MKKIIASVLIAFALFTLIFAGPLFNFWAQMAVSAFFLSALTFAFDHDGMKRLFASSDRRGFRLILCGVGSAAVLYFIFYFSHIAAGYIFPFSGREIESVYALKASAPKWLIALLIICVIGPGEEIFWRGYLQRNLERSHGLTGAIVAALLYTIVHIASWNLMLLAAAFVCGMFWMFLFRRFNSIWINIVSHVVWDISVFILWPF